MLISKLLRRRPCLGSFSVLAIFVLLAATLHAQRLTLNTRTFSASTSAVDAGPVPASQPLSLTVRLAQTPEQKAALDQFLADQLTASSPNYHRWLTPQQFAASYGATDDQLATATAWLQAQGLIVQTVSPAKTRLTVSGTAAQVQNAFSIALRRFQIAGIQYFANTTQPSLPQEIASTISGVQGLDNMPVSGPTVASRLVSTTQTVAQSSSTGTDALGNASAAIDANAAPILTLSVAECSSDLAQTDYDAYRDLFRQASAQGVTVLATNGCSSGTGSFPASLSEVTALATTATASSTNASFVGIDPRPSWQYAPGLPDDSTRQEPDLTTTSADAFAQAMTTIVQQNGGRQGNVNAILYSLATTPDLYTQPDDAPAGTWESATGLGVVNLQKLIKVFPRVTGTATTTALAYNGSSSIGYGTQVVLTASVTPSAFNTANPSGTVTFTSASQGIIGSAPLTNGTATLTLGSLPVGSYTITASYSGDGNYAGSTSTTPVSLTVTIVNATLTATISPATNVPYGSTASVTATVALPNSSGAPAGPVTATIESVTGAVFTATLSPNPGGNTATANIVINAPLPNATPGYTVEVSCQGNTNFQCQSPVDIKSWTTVLGNTLTTMNVSPAAPQAGQPVTLTAIINNAGNGTGTYTFSGNVTFYDNGAQIATAAVATNQATTNKTLAGNIQHSIVAKYSGDANWNPSTSSPQSVSPSLLPATMTLTSNVTTALAGVDLVFTATVFTTVTNTVGPTGNVTFYDTYNGTAIQLGNPTPLTPNGPNESIARLSTTGLLAGGHSVYAVYGGDTNFGGATSSPLAITITDYNLTMVPQTITLHPGQTGQVVMLLGLVGGFNGTVSFGCTPPANAEITCSFNPVTLAGGGTTTMSIVTTAPTAATTTSRLDHRLGRSVAAGPMLAALIFFAVPGFAVSGRRRRLPTMLLVLVALVLTANLGCGLGKTADSTTASDPGTPLGTQIFTVISAGSDGVNSVRHSYQYQITIQ